MPVSLQFIDDELKGRTAIAPAVQIEEQGQVVVTPFIETVINTTYLMVLRSAHLAWSIALN